MVKRKYWLVPYYDCKEYADLYLGLDDPEMPASVKELYSYNPDKAKELLKEAGYPNGFKTSLHPRPHSGRLLLDNQGSRGLRWVLTWRSMSGTSATEVPI